MTIGSSLLILTGTTVALLLNYQATRAQHRSSNALSRHATSCPFTYRFIIWLLSVRIN